MGRRVAQGEGDRLQEDRAGGRGKPGTLGLGREATGSRDLMFGEREGKADGERGCD